MCMTQVLHPPVQLRQRTIVGYIPLAKGYPTAQGKYLDFSPHTIPTVGPFVKYREEASRREDSTF